jgi:hypothetical protein
MQDMRQSSDVSYNPPARETMDLSHMKGALVRHHTAADDEGYTFDDD